MPFVKWTFTIFKNGSLKRTVSYRPSSPKIFTFLPKFQSLKKNNLPLEKLKARKAKNQLTHELINKIYKFKIISKNQVKLMIREAGKSSSLRIMKPKKKAIKVI
jgi:hypothetical protein